MAVTHQPLNLQQPPAPSVSWWHGPYVFPMLVGAGLILVGLLLPWVTVVAPIVGEISRTGIDTDDGKVVLAAAALLAVLVHQDASRPRAGLRVGLTLLSIAIGGVVVVDGVDAADRIASLDSGLMHAEIGVGMWVSGIGAAVAAVASAFRSRFFHQNSTAAWAQRILDQQFAHEAVESRKMRPIGCRLALGTTAALVGLAGIGGILYLVYDGDNPTTTTTNGVPRVSGLCVQWRQEFDSLAAQALAATNEYQHAKAEAFNDAMLRKAAEMRAGGCPNL